MRYWLLAALLVLGSAAQAQNFGNIPPHTVLGNSDPTLSKPAAPIDATPGSANYVPPSGPYAPTPAISAAKFLGVLGTNAAPNTTLDAIAVFEKIGTTSNPPTNAALIGITIDKNPNVSGTGYHGSGLAGVFQTAMAYDGVAYSFGEGGHAQCDVLTGSTNFQCNGLSAIVNFAVNGRAFVGIEGAVNNHTGAAISTLTAIKDYAFMASCGVHLNIPPAFPCGAAFYVNQQNSDPFTCGFCIVAGSGAIAAGGADIALANSGAAYGIDMSTASFTTAALQLPNQTNGGALRIAGVTGGVPPYLVLAVNGSNQLVLNTDTHNIDLVIGTATSLTQVQGRLNVGALPTTGSGGGGVFVCIDVLGQMYKKATCP